MKGCLSTLLIHVSIHASVKDATFLFFYIPSHNYCFNPRICKRCDFQSEYIKEYDMGFNPRICKRCDLVLPVTVHA